MNGNLGGLCFRRTSRRAENGFVAPVIGPFGIMKSRREMKFENNEPSTIVRSFLNDRGKNPSADNFNWHMTYPEPGVLRKYCGGHAFAWADEVVLPSSFRPPDYSVL